MGLGIEGMLILDGGVNNGDKIIGIFIVEAVRHHVPSFDVICKKYLKIWVVHVVDLHIYDMIFRACIRSIFHFVKFYICEIPDYLYFLYLSILLHNLLDIMLVHFLEPAYK